MKSDETHTKEELSFLIKVKNYVKKLFDFSHYNFKTILFIAFFIVLIFFSLWLLWYIYLGGGQTFLFTLIVDWFINPIYLFGFFGILLFIAIMAIQGLIIPIPSEIILLATGMIWGIIGGGIMGVIGSMASALLCFYVSKKGGRPLAEKLVGKRAINIADKFIRNYGMGTIIVARFLPFIAFDPISYASGLVDMDIKKYSIGSLIGSIPRAFFYSTLGSLLTISQGITPPIKLEDLPFGEIERLSLTFNNLLLIILGILFFMFLAYYIIIKYYDKKKFSESISQIPNS